MNLSAYVIITISQAQPSSLQGHALNDDLELHLQHCWQLTTLLKSILCLPYLEALDAVLRASVRQKSLLHMPDLT